ncbi:MAG: Phosphoglycerate kinase [Bacteriovoracaceae bacterium]|nr:Phosphoglycerate kinase [Bacteriovoracaceae bacterium]
MKILRVDEIHWPALREDKRVAFVRVDFNVPIKNGIVLDDFRIKQALPTINYLLEQKCIVVLASHLGRPKGNDEESRKKFTMLPVAEKLAEIMDHEVLLSNDVSGDGVRKLITDGRGGKTIILLENLRFDPREEANDPEYAESLFKYCHLYVNDAFGASHRAHASIEAITHFTKVKAAGYLLSKEWEVLNQVLHHPIAPQMAILGGAKIADKIQVIKNLMLRSKKLFIGGRMAQTFLAAQGYSLGSSSIEEESLPLARRILTEARTQEVEIFFPVDGRAGKDIDAKECKVVSIEKDKPLSKDVSLFDIGPKTVEIWKKELRKAKSIVWNGPMGVFENPTYADGTLSIVDFLLEVKDSIPAIAGGGETVSAITQRNALTSLYHVSTGGGAMLEFLEGKALPGFEALKVRDRDIQAAIDSTIVIPEEEVG